MTTLSEAIIIFSSLSSSQLCNLPGHQRLLGYGCGAQFSEGMALGVDFFLGMVT